MEHYKPRIKVDESWEIVALGEISEKITKGTTPTSVGYKFENSGINFIKIESITEGGSFLPEKFAFISSKCNEDFKRSQLKENDVLFSIAGALGRVAIVSKAILPANTNQALAIVSLKENVEPKYVFWMLKSEKTLQYIEKLKVGVAQYNISLKQVSELKIPCPPFKIQKQIVAQIEEEQKLIEANKKLLEIFEGKIKTKIAEVWG